MLKITNIFFENMPHFMLLQEAEMIKRKSIPVNILQVWQKWRLSITLFAVRTSSNQCLMSVLPLMSCCIFPPLEKALCYVYIMSSVLWCTELQGGDPGKKSEHLLKSSVQQLLPSFVIDWIDSRGSSFIFMQDFWLLFTVNHSLTPISLAKHALIFWG